MRDGQEQLLEPETLVVDDLLIVNPGDQIVVDGPWLVMVTWRSMNCR